jgi:hypothetical protein
MLTLLKKLFQQNKNKNKIAEKIEIKEMSANAWWS